MHVTFAGMEWKSWTPADLRKLASEAAVRGIRKKALAAYIGIDAATLSRWMKDGRPDLPLLSRNAVSHIESELMKIQPLPKAPGEENEEGTR